jgi:hypothetical protein
MRKRKWIVLAPVAILAMIGLVVLGGVVVQQLWNWLLPPLFGWREIGFWQGIGLLALCRILFGGWGGHRSHGSGMRRRMAQRTEAMSPEERERFRQTMRERCGFEPPAAGGSQAV